MHRFRDIEMKIPKKVTRYSFNEQSLKYLKIIRIDLKTEKLNNSV